MIDLDALKAEAERCEQKNVLFVTTHTHLREIIAELERLRRLAEEVREYVGGSEPCGCGECPSDPMIMALAALNANPAEATKEKP